MMSNGRQRSIYGKHEIFQASLPLQSSNTQHLPSTISHVCSQEEKKFARANNLCNGRDGLRRAWSKIQIKRLIQPPPFHHDWQTRAMGLFLISDLLSSFCQGFSGDWEAGEFDNPGSDIFSLLKPQEQSSLLTFGKDTRVTFFLTVRNHNHRQRHFVLNPVIQTLFPELCQPFIVPIVHSCMA